MASAVVVAAVAAIAHPRVTAVVMLWPGVQHRLVANHKSHGGGWVTSNLKLDIETYFFKKMVVSTSFWNTLLKQIQSYFFKLSYGKKWGLFNY